LNTSHVSLHFMAWWDNSLKAQLSVGNIAYNIFLQDGVTLLNRKRAYVGLEFFPSNENMYIMDTTVNLCFKLLMTINTRELNTLLLDLVVLYFVNLFLIS
ncbi:hypothetical protein ACJX0J_020594, partial [Zea mays]